MSFKKKMLAFLAVSALSAATAVPAMALENEFHGMYKAKFFLSNFDNTGSGTSGAYAVTPDKYPTSNYFEQRARIFYNAKANDNLKLVVAFELDSVFGDKSQGSLPGNGATGVASTAFRNTGGALDTDSVNLETKWVHLDFNVPGAPVNVKVGTQAIKDAVKGILFDVDAGGIQTSTKLGSSTVNLGYFRGYEAVASSPTASSTSRIGDTSLSIVTAEAKDDISKDLSFGAAYYGIFDDRKTGSATTQSTVAGVVTDTTTSYPNPALRLHTVALTADAKLADIALSGFVAAQTGSLANQYVGGYAANVAAKVKAGPGTAHAAFLYTSGDDGKNAGSNHSWQALSQTVNGTGTMNDPTKAGTLNTYNESGMLLLNRNAAGAGTQSDRYIVNSTNFKNQGLTGAFVGYDANLSSKLYANANIGFALASEDNQSAKPVITGTTTGHNSSNFLGTEINVETGYKLYDNLTTSVQAAYVILGDYYKGTATNSSTTSSKDPMNPYTARVVLSYAF